MSAYTVRTALTEAQGDVHCSAQVLHSAAGEEIISLIAAEGREREVEQLQAEWENILNQTLLAPPPEGESSYDRLEGALKEMNGLIKGMLIGEAIRDVHALLGIVEEDGSLHISAAGRSEAYLIRGGNTVQITEQSGSGREIPHFLHIASGDLEKDDIVIFSSVRLLRSLTPAQITKSARNSEALLEDIQQALEQERESAALAILETKEMGTVKGHTDDLPEEDEKVHTPKKQFSHRKRPGQKTMPLSEALAKVANIFSGLPDKMGKAKPVTKQITRLCTKICKGTKRGLQQFWGDLHHPTRKRKAHLLLLASALIIFIAIVLAFRVSSGSRINQDRADLERLVAKINQDLRTAENRQLMGDLESANAILSRAEQEASDVMKNESGLFRTDALELLNRIRSKREVINNVIRVTPTVAANLANKNPDVSSRGVIGIERGRLIVYDKQNLYSIIVNDVDDPQRLDGENLIIDGDYFDRYKTTVFMTKENRLIELIEGLPTAMKTDDPAGWLTGPDMETYNRFLYILSPQNNQIYKYERLSNRYSEPSEYRVSDVQLSDGIDMAIDSDVYILNRDGSVTKLLRGEDRPFSFRNLPENAMDNVTKMEKNSDQGNFFFMDPEGRRIIVTRREDDLGESLYLKQYILEGEQIGELQDIFIDDEETQLYILDEKRMYSVNLQER